MAGYLGTHSGTIIVVVDVAALRALASNLFFAGLYSRTLQARIAFWRWDATSMAADDGVAVAKPSDVLIGDPGRWLAAGELTTVPTASSFGAVGDGVADDTTAVQSLNSASAEAAYAAGSYLLTTATIGSIGTTHRFERGAVLVADSGEVVTVRGQIDAADDQRVFDATVGSFLLPDVASLRVGWFGAEANGTTDDEAAINATISAASDAVEVQLMAGRTYATGAPILADKPVALRSQGKAIVRALAGSDFAWLLLRTVPGSGLRLEGIEFDANGANRPSTTAALGCIRVENTSDLVFRDVSWCNPIGSTLGGETVGCQLAQCDQVQMSDIAARDCGTTAFPCDSLYVSGDGIIVQNYVADRVHDTAFVAQLADNVVLDGFKATDCQAGVAVGPFGSTDQRNVVIANGVIGCTIGAGGREAVAITAVTAATPIHVTATAHGRSNADRVYVSGVSGVPEANGLAVVTNATTNAFDLYDLVGSPVAGTGSYVSGGYVQPTHQAVGIDFGTYGSVTDSGELNGLTIDNVLIDDRMNIGTSVIQMYAGNLTSAPATKAITGAVGTPIVITATAHGYLNGQVISQFAVQGNLAANGRFKIANKSTNTYELTDMNGNPVASNGTYVASTGFAQRAARTRNVKMRGVKVLGENIYSYAAYLVNVEGLDIEGCDFEGDSNPTVLFDSGCVDVGFHWNKISTKGTAGAIINTGCHRLRFTHNFVRGKNVTTTYGIFFNDTSTEVYEESNIATGSGIVAGAGSSATVLSRSNVDLVNVQTAAGAKTWSGAAVFSSTLRSGFMGVGVASSGTIAFTAKGGNGLFTADLAAPASGVWGLCFAAGVYGAIIADPNTANGIVHHAYAKHTFNTGASSPGTTRGFISDTLADFSVTVQADTINEHGSGTGVTIDGLLLRDGRLDDAKWRSQVVQFLKDAADGAAGTVTTERSTGLRFPYAVTITGAFFVPDANLTSNNTDYATLNVWKRDLNGANQAAIASASTTVGGTGNWAQYKPVNFGVITNAALPSGSSLFIEILKPGAGVIVPTGVWVITYSVD